MKWNLTLAGALMALVLCVIPAYSQTASAPAGESTEPTTQLKLQIVLSEMDGAKKVSVLPYTLRLLASAQPETTVFKTGMRIPIRTGGKDPGEYQLEYLDVGTNINSSARTLVDGRYQLSLAVERSEVYVANATDKPAVYAPNQSSLDPIIQQFSDKRQIIIRDGQTVQVTMAGDPVTGHITTMDVTINVEK
jgi:hypothetical protein